MYHLTHLSILNSNLSALDPLSQILPTCGKTNRTDAHNSVANITVSIVGRMQAVGILGWDANVRRRAIKMKQHSATRWEALLKIGGDDGVGWYYK